MKTDKTDRRTARTQRLLGEALINLMHERRYEDITVQDLLDRADIGRATFYSHYYDKDDLLASELERVVRMLTAHLDMQPGSAAGPFTVIALFEHIQEHRRLYYALARGQGVRVALEAIQTQLRQRMERHIRLNLHLPDSDLMPTVITHGAVGAFMALLQWWVDTDMAVEPEQMNEYFQRLVCPGVREMLALTDTNLAAMA